MERTLRPITTQIAILARLFARLEGNGQLMASVPGSMRLLGMALVDTDSEMTRLIPRKGRWEFHVRQDAVKWIHGLEGMPIEAIAKDQKFLRDMMVRLANFGDPQMRPLRKLELEILQLGLGYGKWCAGIPLEVDDGNRI